MLWIEIISNLLSGKCLSVYSHWPYFPICNQYWVFHYYLTRQIFNQVEYCKLRSIFTTVSKVTFEYLKEVSSLLWATAKDYSIVDEAEVDVFLKFSCFFYDPADVGNLVSGSSAFSKSSLNIWKFSAHILWSLNWRILSITLLACEMSAIVR